jgi:5-methylcytosine-specific restriction endonuclease McrA
LREQVFHRDRGVCAVCRIDCDKLERVFRRLLRKAGLKPTHYPAIVARDPDHYGPLDIFRQEFPWFRPDISPWAADHIIPVAEGGGECGLEGIRTLCLNCHAQATKALRERLTRKNEQELI